MTRRRLVSGPAISGATGAAPSSVSATPISSDESDVLFASLRGYRSLLLAVSGGRDSMALLNLASSWRDRTPDAPTLFSATVDHGLRPAACEEVALAAAHAAACNVPHTTLTVTRQAPATGVQAWAREARYEALAALAASLGCAALVTGHQAEDQAETLLMRLARGSGVDGLAAMSVQTRRGKMMVLRPLLHIQRARLTATLTQHGVSWADDPSNSDPRFERAGFQRHHEALADLGLTPAALGRTARRLEDARTALDWAATAMLKAMPECLEALRAAAYGDIARLVFDAQPVELRRRVLARVLQDVGGLSGPPRLDRLEALVDRIAAAPAAGGMRVTFAGCQLVVTPETIAVYREPGRKGFPVLRLEPGETALWDNRFTVSLAPDLPKALTIRALSDWPLLEEVQITAMQPSGQPSGKMSDMPGLDPATATTLPKRARAAIPAFWQDDVCVAVPQIGHFDVMARRSNGVVGLTSVACTRATQPL